MLRKRYYILFVARDEDGQLRKIPVPLRYAYCFLAAAAVGTFTIVGLAGSYTRMLLKTESYNQVRQERETLRKDYSQMAQLAHDRSIQVASLGALANEVTALYGLRQNRLAVEARAEERDSAARSAPAFAPDSPARLDDQSSDPSAQQIERSMEEFYALRTEALSGQAMQALEGALNPAFTGDWTELANAPSMWPIEGRVASSFGEREDPFNGEGAFHTGIDIDAPFGAPVRATADGDVVRAGMASGYGRVVELDHGHGLSTLYGHLSGFAVLAGEHVTRGQIIGYVGESGRATGPHLHYEVRVHDAPVNPHKYLRETYEQVAGLDAGAAGGR